MAVVLVYALYNITYSALSYPAGVLSDRLGRWRIIAVGWTIYAGVYAGFALLPASRLDVLLLARTSVLALAYVPGRTVTLLPDDLRRVTLGVRADVAPWLVLALVLSVLALAAGRRLQPRPAPAP